MKDTGHQMTDNELRALVLQFIARPDQWQFVKALVNKAFNQPVYQRHYDEVMLPAIGGNKMAGYGNADDHVGAVQAHVDDSLALARALATPADNDTGACLECGEEIPKPRQRALPGCRHCVDCQSAAEKVKGQFAQFQVRNTYVP